MQNEVGFAVELRRWCTSDSWSEAIGCSSEVRFGDLGDVVVKSGGWSLLDWSEWMGYSGELRLLELARLVGTDSL